MNRVNEKVKDLIEVCSYSSLQDFHADPAETLKGYHFTDVTSQLMVTWLDSLIDLPSRNSNAKALAGYRGVGKSHFLSAFASIISNPELRSSVQDTHVAASAHHLMRRTYPVASVRRGTAPDLDAELRIAVAESLSCELEELPSDLRELMVFADSRVVDVPLVIIVDTALGRESRVTRDDGVVLGRMAEAVRDLNIFIGVALDDDITDADGINSAIASSFSIDYLDQEHLYRIVDTHLFRKHRRAQSLIQDIYNQFRSDLTAFRWSDQRFASLYPLHPVILEVAPFVRLYAPEFALLGFAAEAGKRILGRPANSLIALDEVFDSVEDTLRKAPDLEKSFATYDAISKEVVSLIPVMQRLQAKLILKGLFILSLDGDGTTASEIAAAMLIYNEEDPSKSETEVLELLETFVSIFPDDLNRKEDGGELRFSFKVAGKDDLISALAQSVSEVSESVVPKLLSRVANERFSDWNLSLGDDESAPLWTDTQLIWRGGIRKARFRWAWGVADQVPSQAENPDVEITICEPGGIQENEDADGTNRFQWIPAELTKEEIDTFRRYHLLLHDEEIKEIYQDQVRAAGHTHSQNINKIWERVFLTEGRIVASTGDLTISGDAAESQSLGEMFSKCLEPVFAEKYPEHPVFEETLELKHVSILVNDLFSGARASNVEAQQFARLYAEPLGLVNLQGDAYVLAKEDAIQELPSVASVAELLSAADGTVSLDKVSEKLSLPPAGLVKEAQQLILTALVAHRRAEFVTTKGDRINRRSLDLKIIWDDIAGIAKPADLQYSPDRLMEWAAAVTGIEDLKSIDKADDRKQVREGLITWLTDWEEANLMNRFSGVPDELLNTAIWHISVSVDRAFGSVAESIRALKEETISLEEGVQRIADSFSDSDSEYESREKELVKLVSFIKYASLKEDIWGYLAICEITESEEVEGLRKQVLDLLDLGFKEPNADTNKNISAAWKEFHAAFSDHFAVKHDSIMKSHQLQERFDAFTKGDFWWEFERLSAIPVFQDVYWRKSQKILGQLRELDCSFDVRKHLNNHPFCACSFNLSRMHEWEDLPDDLARLVEHALEGYRKTLSLLGPDLSKRLKEFVKNEEDDEALNVAKSLLKAVENDDFSAKFSTEQLAILHKVITVGETSQMITAQIPQPGDIRSAENLRAELGQWLDTLPAEPVLVKIK